MTEKSDSLAARQLLSRSVEWGQSRGAVGRRGSCSAAQLSGDRAVEQFAALAVMHGTIGRRRNGRPARPSPAAVYERYQSDTPTVAVMAPGRYNTAPIQPTGAQPGRAEHRRWAENCAPGEKLQTDFDQTDLDPNVERSTKCATLTITKNKL